MVRDKERGAAVVEFSLVVPLLLLVIFGIIEFSILFYDKAVITNASREAAREWILHRDIRLTETQIQSVVDAYTQDRLISLTTESFPVIEARPYDKDGNLVALSAIDSGYQLKLTVNYTYDFLFLPGFISGLLPTVDLSARTVMRAE